MKKKKIQRLVREAVDRTIRERLDAQMYDAPEADRSDAKMNDEMPDCSVFGFEKPHGATTQPFFDSLAGP